MMERRRTAGRWLSRLLCGVGLLALSSPGWTAAPAALLPEGGPLADAPGGPFRADADSMTWTPFFEENRGQVRGAAKFLADAPEYRLFLESEELVVVFGPGAPSSGEPFPEVHKDSLSHSAFTTVRLRILGGDPLAAIAGEGLISGVTHYYRGSDPSRWTTEVPHYARVRYHHVYPGTDLLLYWNQGAVEYDFVLAPGADPGRIRLGVDGADRVALEPGGDLVIEASGIVVRQTTPLLYQSAPEGRRLVEGGYALQPDGEISFRVGAYDPGTPLVIDPLILYSTYAASSIGPDWANDIAVTREGDMILGGTLSFVEDYSWSQYTYEAFVSRVSPRGSLSRAVLGGSSEDHGTAIAVTPGGEIVVTGWTESPDFPTTPGAFPKRGGPDAFLTRLSPSLSIRGSTYFGGNLADDFAFGVAVDDSGNAYITGETRAIDPGTSLFQVLNARQPQPGGGFTEAFVAGFAPSGALLFSTFLGGSGDESGHGIAFESPDTLAIVGTTSSQDFPTELPLRGYGGGASDAFLANIGTTVPAARLFTTYWGGSGAERGLGVDVGATSQIGPMFYITGSTDSTDFPTVQAVQDSFRGGPSDAFVAAIQAVYVEFSTYLGGSPLVEGTEYGGDVGWDIVVSEIASQGMVQRRAHVVGTTLSDDFPTAPFDFRGLRGDAPDAFVTKFGPWGDILEYSMLLGGRGHDAGYGIDLHPLNPDYALVAGVTFSQDFPVTGSPGYMPYQQAKSGRPNHADSFVSLIQNDARCAMEFTCSFADTLDRTLHEVWYG